MLLPLPKNPLPPLSADCETSILKPAAPGGKTSAPEITPSSIFRSSDGKFRRDTGNTSVITDPHTQQIIRLDHLKKEAMCLPMEALPKPELPAGHQAGLPGMPQGTGEAPQFKDLGTKMISGQEAKGREYTIHPPKLPGLPKLPGMPKLPQMPKLPEMPKPPEMPKMADPKLPQPPHAPQAPQAQPPAPHGAPHIMELWTAEKLHLPVLTKVKGPSGMHIEQYKNILPGEPDPSKFKVPPGYKTIHPPKLTMPKLKLPGIKMPKLPKLPKLPG